jgi:hypothetical protein
LFDVILAFLVLALVLAAIIGGPVVVCLNEPGSICNESHVLR